MISKVFSTINSRMDTLTNSEKKVAEYVLDNSSETTSMTVSELASACKVSEATIIRFVKKLEYDSFQDFKLFIATDNAITSNHEDLDITINRNDDMKTIFSKVESGFIRTIESTSSITDLDKYKETINLLRTSNRIEIYGVGSSNAVAKVLNYKLTRLGFPSYSIEDTHMQAISASTMKTGDLAIGISQSGSTKDIVDSLMIAKKHNASTICITDHVQSPITKYSDVLLQTYSRENPVKTSAGRSIVAQIFVVELLTAMLNSFEYEKAEIAGRETAKSVVNKLY